MMGFGFFHFFGWLLVFGTALLIVFVAMVVIFFISLFGNGVGNLYSTIIDYL